MPFRISVLALQVNGAPLQGCPCKVTVTPGMSFAPLCEMLAQDLPTLRSCEAGVEKRFTICAKDQNGNRMHGGGATFTGQLKHQQSRSKAIPLRSSDLRNGSYSMALTAAASGAYDMTISMDGVPIMGSPFEVHVRAASGQLRVRELAQKHVAGKVCQFHVEQIDEFGNTNELYPKDVSISLEACEQTAGTHFVHVGLQVVEGGLRAMFTAERAGKFLLHVQYHKNGHLHEIVGAPFTMDVVPSECSLSDCMIVDLPSAAVPVRHSGSFMIVSRDRFQNIRATDADEFSVRFLGPAAVEVGVVPQADGCHMVHFKGRAVGMYNVCIQHASQPGQRMFKIEFGCSATHPPNCIAFAPRTQTIRAGEYYSFKLLCRDQLGNPCNRVLLL